jgi:Tol biopolymer transport system component
MDGDIWRIGLQGRTQGTEPATKLISSTRLDHNAEYSPDGKRIVFNSHRSGTEEVWVSNADGTNPMQLTRAGGPMVANPRWSPDAQALVIHSLLGGVRGIDVMSANGSGLRRLTVGGSHPTWSRDGKWIYFGRGGQVRKAPADGGEAVQVTREGGGGAAFESVDGKFLYYVKGSRIWNLPLGGGPETLVVNEPLSYGSNYALVEDGLYFVAGSPGVFASPGVLYFFDFASRGLTPVTTVKSWSLGLTVSPDRRSILYTEMEPPKSSLMLVENFR